MDGVEDGGSSLLQPEITTEVWDDLFTTSSDEDHPRPSETVELSITQAHRDPLEECMDGVEAFVHSVLKTGKVTVTGEAGDLSKLHSVLFGLQATEKELPQLLPQLLHHPLFAQNPSPPGSGGGGGGSGSGGGSRGSMDEGQDRNVGGYKTHDYLGEGHLQVGVHIDTLIYHLLHSHCCSQAKQAELLVETSLAHVSSTSSSTELGPPLIFASSMRRPPQPPLSSLFLNIQTGPSSLSSVKSNSSSSLGSEKVGSERSQSQSSYMSNSSMDENFFPPDPLSPISEFAKDIGESTSSTEGPPDQKKEVEPPHNGIAGSSTASVQASQDNSSGSGLPCTPGDDQQQTHPTGFAKEPAKTATRAELQTTPSPSEGSASKTSSISTIHTPLRNPSIKKAQSEEKRTRKTSVVSMRTRSTKSSDSDDDSTLEGRSGKHGGVGSGGGGGGGGDSWHVYSPDPKDLVIATYGDNTYPLVMWDPTLKVEFKLSSSLGILSGSVIAIEPSRPTVTIKVKNPTAMEIGFSVRAYRQTTVRKMHIVYPTQGLHKMDPYDHWEDNADFMSSENQEFFVLDLFVCTLSGSPAWNVIRKYAVMKAVNKSNTNTLAVSKPRKFTHFQLPGSSETKEQNLKSVIAQGLQCVIKDKLLPAEIIFTQAQLLPDFQRLPLLAYVHICLAVIANKKTKESRNSLQPMIAHSNCVSKLLDICDSSPAHVKMPKMIMLVKQLKKELNLEKLIKETKKREKRIRLQKSSNSSIEVDSAGGRLSLTGEGVALNVPPGALQQEVKITVATTDVRQLQSMLFAKGWDQTITIVTAHEIHCTPLIEQFEKPVEVLVAVPAHHVPLLLGNPQLCLMHSKYMRHWQDITTETSSNVRIIKDSDGGGDGTQISIQTDQVGFLAVTWVNLDPFKIAQIAMRSLVAEPVVVQISASAELYPDDNAAQLVISIQPCKPHGEPLIPSPVKPQDHTPISFPHTVQAYAGEKLRLSLVGHFEAHDGYGQTDLNFACDVSTSINQMFEKWVRLQTGTPLTGKLLVSSCRTSGGSGGGPASYEMLAEINISTRTSMRCSSSSST